MAYFDILRILILKNFRLTIRERFSLITQILAPFIAILLLFFTDLTIQNNDGFNPDFRELRNPEERELGIIPRCTTNKAPSCITIAYVPKENPKVDGWIDKVASMSKIPKKEIRAFQTSEELNKHLRDNPNTTQAAYIFEQWDLGQIEEGNVSFTVQYNQTFPSTFPLGDTSWNTHFLVPTMIVAMNKVLFPEVTEKEFDINLKSSVFPHPRLNLDDDDAFIQQGPFVLYATYSLSVVFFLAKLVGEKEKKLREAMKLAGQRQSHHFLSWGVLFVVSMIITTFLLIISGHVFRLTFFTRTSFPVYFLTFLIFALALIPWVFFYDLITRNSALVSSIVFNFFITFYLLAVAGRFVYATDENGDSIVTGGATALREIFALFPPVMFTKCLVDIAAGAAIGRGLSMSDISDNSILFPIRTCWIWMTVTSTVLMIVLIYLDNVVPNGYSVPLKPWYLFTKSYWGFRSKNNAAFPAQNDLNSSPEDEVGQVLEFSIDEAYDGRVEDSDVRRERELVENGQRDSWPLVIRDIHKKFGRVTAVDGISMSVGPGDLFAVLGHNGAGKSTLFNMLTGQTSVTSGTASIYGLDVRRDQVEIRKLLGVCPQHNILWDLLTAKEHLDLFATLKGVSRQNQVAEIKSRLMDVGLEEVANKRSSKLSGGMQRRLNVAISLIGDPRMLLMDEPSTGADPVARRELWSMIQSAKQGRVIVLITHSMAEAEILGDRIGIVARGKLRVLGSSLHLKNKFGAGYKLKVRLKERENVDIITQMCASARCGAKLERTVESDDGTDSVLAEYSLDRGAGDDDIAELIKKMEKERDEGNIEYFGLSQTTLEDVFVKITSLTEDDSPDETLQKCGCGVECSFMSKCC